MELTSVALSGRVKVSLRSPFALPCAGMRMENFARLRATSPEPPRVGLPLHAARTARLRFSGWFE